MPDDVLGRVLGAESVVVVNEFGGVVSSPAVDVEVVDWVGGPPGELVRLGDGAGTSLVRETEDSELETLPLEDTVVEVDVDVAGEPPVAVPHAQSPVVHAAHPR